MRQFFTGLILSFSVTLTPHTLAMMRLTDQVVDGSFGYARDKAQLPRSLGKPKTFLYHQQNRRPSGAAAQRCKAPS
jgi:hypothetical protein